MKAYIERKRLVDAVNNVTKVVPPTNSNPSLTYLGLRFMGDALVMFGSNLDLDIEAKLELNEDIEGEGVLAVPSAVFKKIIKAMAGEVVELNLIDRELEVKSGSSRAKIQTLNTENLVSVQFPDVYEGSIDSTKFAKILESVRYAASTAEYQQIFRGVLLELSSKQTRAVSTDGFRLGMNTIKDSSGLDAKIVIPSKNLPEIVAMLGESPSVEIGLSESSARLYLSNKIYKLNVSLMEGTFPDYERVIPSQNLLEFTIDSKELSEAVSRASVMSSETSNNRVDFFVKGDSIRITAKGAYGEAEEDIAIEVVSPLVEGDSITLAYNANYLKDALKDISDRAKFSISGSTSPTILKEADDKSEHEVLSMIVPLRTDK